jgi:Holliday junction resolvase RusA-like endonuclease
MIGEISNMSDPWCSEDWFGMHLHDLKPVAWSVPNIGTGTKKDGTSYRFTTRNKHLDNWQRKLHEAAAARMKDGGQEIYLGPLSALVEFQFATECQADWGKPLCPKVVWDAKRKIYVKKGKNIPDADNLAKAALDALQGVCFGNDGQICLLEVRRAWAVHDGVWLCLDKIISEDMSSSDEQSSERSAPGEIPSPVRVRRG